MVTTGHLDAGTGENIAKDRRGVVPSERQIAEFISEIRGESSIRPNEAQRFEPVEVEDVGPEETLSGVHPLPVNCPLLLVNLDEMRDDIESVLGPSQGETVALHETVLNGGVSTRGEPSKGTVTNVESIG